MNEASRSLSGLARAGGALRKGWLWFYSGPPVRGVLGIVLSELLLTAALVLSGESLRRTSGALYAYLFIILWAAFQWGFLHALLATALALGIGALWVGSPGKAPGPDIVYDLWIWMFGFVALALSGAMTQVRAHERTLRSRYETQRNIAVTVQRALLPQTREVPGYDVAFHYHPASRDAAVGGDFLDIWELADGRFGILLGDVTGHGVDASVQTAEIRYSLRALAYHGLSPQDCANTVNDILHRGQLSDRLATMFFAVLNDQTHTLEYVNAGQNPPLLWHADGSTEWLERTGLILGVTASSAFGYETGERTLGPGDGIMLYTDGVTEARRGKEFFGPERLCEVVLHARIGSASAMIASLHQEVQEFSGNQSRDDIAVLCVKRCADSDAGRERWNEEGGNRDGSRDGATD